MIIIMGMEIVLTYPQYPGNPKSYLVFAVIHKKVNYVNKFTVCSSIYAE